MSPGSCEINKKQSGNSFAGHPVYLKSPLPSPSSQIPIAFSLFPFLSHLPLYLIPYFFDGLIPQLLSLIPFILFLITQFGEKTQRHMDISLSCFLNSKVQQFSGKLDGAILCEEKLWLHDFQDFPYMGSLLLAMGDCICLFQILLNLRNQWIRVLEHSRTFYINS